MVVEGAALLRARLPVKVLTLPLISFQLAFVHLKPQSTNRLDSNKATNLYLAVRFCKLKSEPREERRQKTLHLQSRKALSDAATRPMQERDVRIRALRASRRSVGALEPPVWLEFGRVIAPESTTAIDGPWGYRHLRAFGNAHVADCCWDGCVAGCGGYGG